PLRARGAFGVARELMGEAGADLVDDRQLAGPLRGLDEEAFRLVEEAGVLERDAHARGDRADHAFIALAERVALGLARRARPAPLASAGDRDAEPGFGRVRVELVGGAHEPAVLELRFAA